MDSKHVAGHRESGAAPRCTARHPAVSAHPLERAMASDIQGVTSPSESSASIAARELKGRAGIRPTSTCGLLALLATRREIVTREESRRHSGDGTFVDFERSINFSIKQIQALGDSAENRFVEQFPGSAIGLSRRRNEWPQIAAASTLGSRAIAPVPVALACWPSSSLINPRRPTFVCPFNSPCQAA
jgi:hypothetical protein